MAIIKAISKTSKSNAGMRNAIEYIMNPIKSTVTETLEDGTIIENKLIDFNGPLTVGEDLNYLTAYKSFREQKQTWNKLDGKMYYHNVISFPPNDELNPYDVMEIAQNFVHKFFSDYQCVIAVHDDKDHLHAHIITNSVSYLDGMKCHVSPKTLRDMKNYIVEVCREKGLTIAEKGKHYDGTTIEPFEVRTYNKDKWHLLANDTKKSYLVDCACAIDEAMHSATNKDEFIDYMLKAGWKVTWTDKRKHITFENEDGKKVRDSNISKTFNMNVSKEDLENEFKKQNQLRQQQSELNRYREELSGDNRATETALNNERISNYGLEPTDTDAFLRQIEADEKHSRNAKRERQLEKLQRFNAPKRTTSYEREESDSFDYDR